MNASSDYEIDFLANRLNVLPDNLLSILEIPSELRYTTRKHLKKSGRGFRIIYKPVDFSLKLMQRKIHQWLLKNFFKEIEGVYGFGPGIKTSSYYYAVNNKEWRWFFSFDIKDAFPSTDINRLQFIIGKLCNRWFYQQPGGHAAKLAEILINLLTVNDVSAGKLILPQGVATSPFLFWLSLFEQPRSTEKSMFYLLERTIKKYLGDEPDWQMSCYIDNFLVGSRNPIPMELQDKILCIPEQFGLHVHKIRYQDIRCGSPRLCGWHIREKDNHKTAIIPRPRIKKWRAIMHKLSFDQNNKYLCDRVKGFLASIHPAYKQDALPPQLAKPFAKIAHLF